MKPSFSEWSESDDEPYEDNEPIRKRILRKGVGVIEMEYSEDQMIAYCPHCKQAGFRVRLDPKILMPGETRQPEYESWWECKDCHEIVSAYVVEHDGTIITNAVETVESPYENQTEIMGILREVHQQVKKQQQRENEIGIKCVKILKLML